MTDFQIPVKKHVKKWLVKRYGNSHTISKKSAIGMIMLELLTKEVCKPDIDLHQFEYYTIEVPEYYFNKRGFDINRNHKKLLGICLEKLFFENFYQFVDLELSKGGNAYQSVALFLQIHHIGESDMKLESMYRNYQRYSSENIKQKKPIIVKK